MIVIFASIAFALFTFPIGIALAEEPVEMTIGYYEASGGLGITGKTMEAIIDSFRETYPDIKVVSQQRPYGAFFDQLPVHLAAGVGPDVWLSDGVLVDQFAHQGWAMDLTGLIEQLPDPDMYFGIEDNRDPQGRIWAFPQGLQASALFYNTDLFENSAVAFPTDEWDLTDLREAARKLTRYTGDGEAEHYGYRSANNVSEGWFSIIRSFGGQVLDETRTQSRFNDPATIAALEYMVDMIHEDRIAHPHNMGQFDMFPQERVAMQHAIYYRTFAPNEAGVSYDVSLVPRGPAGRFAPVIVNSWVINGQTDKAKQEAAWKWVMFFSDEDAQSRWAELGEAVPINREVALDVFLNLDSPPTNRMAFVHGLQYSVPLDPNPVWGEWTKEATNALAPAFRGESSVADAALQAHHRVQTVLDSFYKAE